MTPTLPDSQYRNIARRLAEALERQHERLAPLSDDDEPQPKRKSRRAVTQRQGKQVAERLPSPRL